MKAKIDRKTEALLLRILPKRIEKGVRYLDNKVGRKEWLSRINVLKLDLGNEHTCVCGQVFGDFFYQFSETKKGVPLGFALPAHSPDWQWELHIK